MDLEELDAVAAGQARGLVGLFLERGQQRLEPLKRARVLADPDELDTTQARGRVGRVAQVPDVLEDRGPRGDADAGTNEDGDFILKDVLGGCSVRAIDAERGHLLAVLQGNFVHALGAHLVVQLCLGVTGTKGITESLGKVTDLADVNGHVGVKGARGDGKRMPLVLGDGRDLKEQPLTGLVSEGRLAELNLDDVVWVANDTGDLGLATGTNFTIQTLQEVETTSPELPTPAEITDTVLPVFIASKRRKGVDRVTDETAGRVSVKRQEKGNEKMVRVPKRFKGLLADTRVGRGVHEHHAKQHDVTSDTARLAVVNLDSRDRSNLGFFDIVKVDIVSRNVGNAEYQESVGELSVQPDVFIERQESNLGADPSHNRAANREEDEHTVDAQDETSTARNPN